jgi:hypothetical protein
MVPKFYDFSTIPVGTNTEWGVIAICPYCGRPGIHEKIENKEFFTHSIDFGIDDQGHQFIKWDMCPSKRSRV